MVSHQRHLLTNHILMQIHNRCQPLFFNLSLWHQGRIKARARDAGERSFVPEPPPPSARARR